MNKPCTVLSKNIVFDGVSIVLLLSKSYGFFDVIMVSGDISVLRKIKKRVHCNSLIIESSIYEKMALLVLDTCDSFSEGKKLFNLYEKRIRKGK